MTGPMVIAGAGECGVRAALGLREAGYRGEVMLIGAERHAPYERPPMSKELMLAATPLPPRTIATAQRLADAEITFYPSRPAVAIDRPAKRLQLADGTALPYEKLLLATGASPRRLSAPGADGDTVTYLRTYDDALRIHARIEPGTPVAIVGGGFIGLELAAAARQRGAAVTVIEALPRLLTRGVPEEIASRIAARHAQAGVTFMFGRAVAAIGPDAVRLSDESMVPAGLVVVGIGATPETALAAGAGLEIENGVKADALLCTSDPDIFAAGDCCSFPLELYGGRRVRLESWRSAQELGGLAARNMLGAAEPIAAVPWFWTDQYELTMQIAGLCDEGERTVRRQSGETLMLFHLKADGRLAAASGIGPGNAVARDIRVAEMLIARRARPDPAALADPAARLKGLLAE
ncbi:MAG TPA: FAD-dependent oxidoreductase [Devosia sp.]|nr:FAD-dependent oxidoreductase [Devosia sp.]